MPLGPIILNRDETLVAIAASVSVLVADIVTGEIYYASPKAEAIFGYHMTGDLAGKSVNVLIPPDMRAKHDILRAQYSDNPVARPMLGRTLTGLRRDGSQVNVSISIDPIVISGRPCDILTIVENPNATNAARDRSPGQAD